MLLAQHTMQIVLLQLAGRDAIMLNIRAACVHAPELQQWFYIIALYVQNAVVMHVQSFRLYTKDA